MILEQKPASVKFSAGLRDHGLDQFWNLGVPAKDVPLRGRALPVIALRTRMVRSLAVLESVASRTENETGKSVSASLVWQRL